MIATGRLEERFACFVDSGRSCCGILRTDTAGQYVRKDATSVMMYDGPSARRVLNDLRRQSIPGHIRELARENLPYVLIVLRDESGAHSEEGGEHAGDEWSLTM
jgi:hypothetical protein